MHDFSAKLEIVVTQSQRVIYRVAVLKSNASHVTFCRHPRKHVSNVASDANRCPFSACMFGSTSSISAKQEMIAINVT